MKILVFGAGVLGSLYAARLREAGCDVSLLARGKRLEEIRARGIILEDAFSGQCTVTSVNLVEDLEPSKQYDYIIVLVRKNQLSNILPIIGKNIHTPNILFMVNNPQGYQGWIEAVGKERLMTGFAGAGGTYESGIVKYALAPGFFQPTTLAELGGQQTARLMNLVRIFRQAGFPTTTSNNMDAWQKTHVAWVSPLANSIYMAEKHGLSLEKSRHVWELAIEAIRESYVALEKIGVPIMPPMLNFWRIVPKFLLAEILRVWSRKRHFKILILRHSLAAKDEMRQIASEFAELVEQAGIAAPAFQELKAYTTDLVK